MMVRVFIVVEEGVYRHRILGVYNEFRAAVIRALVVSDQGDGYHTCEVCSCCVDVAIDDVTPIGHFAKTRTPRSAKIQPSSTWQWGSDTMRSSYGKELEEIQSGLTRQPPQA